MKLLRTLFVTVVCCVAISVGCDSQPKVQHESNCSRLRWQLDTGFKYYPAISASPDGRLVCVFVKDHIDVLDSESKETRLSIDSSTFDVAYSPDGSRLVVVDTVHNVVSLWDLIEFKKVASFQSNVGPLGNPCVTSQWIYLSDKQGQIWQLDIESRSSKCVFRLSDWPTEFEYILQNDDLRRRDLKHFTVLGDETVIVPVHGALWCYDLNKTSFKWHIEFGDSQCQWLAICDDRKVAAKYGYHDLKVLDADTGNILKTIPGTRRFSKIATDARGIRFFFVSRNIVNHPSEMWIYDEKQDCKFTLFNNATRDVCVSASGELLGAVSRDGVVRIWDVIDER